MDLRKTKAKYDEVEYEEVQSEHAELERKEKRLRHEQKRLRTIVEELEKQTEGLPKGTTMWNDKGEQVSTFQIEDDRMWMIVERVGEYSVMHCFQTEQVCFDRLIDVIRRDKLVEAVILITEGKRFMLQQISWEEIARRAIKKMLG